MTNAGTSGGAAGQPRTITVTGTGRASVRPDLADLRLGVTITAPTVESARSATSSALAAVLAKLKALGIEEGDLQTSIVSVSPQYDYSREGAPPRLAGYTFANLVAAVVRDIERVGEAIDAALTAGATNVDRIAFRVEDQSGAEREAREAAVADARVKAETFAAAAGVTIEEVAAIIESGMPIPYPTPMAERMAFAARDASTPIEPGTNEVTATVTITYLVAGAEGVTRHEGHTRGQGATGA
jgi:uncharacterized protein YggE